MNGSEIIGEKNYIGATIDFLLLGGDDFKDVINNTYLIRKKESRGDYRKLVRPFLEEMKTIEANTLIDSLNPRLIVN